MILFTNQDALGAIPYFFDLMDGRPAKAQIDENYQHGGGYGVCPGKWEIDKSRGQFRYALVYVLPKGQTNEVFPELGRGKLGMETIIVFRSAFTAIIQANGDFEVIRMD